MTTDDLKQHVTNGTITFKEAQVLELHHLSDRQISLALGISRRSVRDRRKNAARKIALHQERSGPADIQPPHQTR